MNKELIDSQIDKKSKKIQKYKLILYNDDYNTFDHVADSIVEVCNYTYEQACQCAIIAHYKGKYDIKSGTYNALLPIKNRLTDKELTVTIE